MKRLAALLLWTYGLTVALHGVLCLLASERIDPVRFVAGTTNDAEVFRYHGKPVFSASGAVIWLAVIPIYVFAVALSYGRRRPTHPWSLIATFFISVLIVAVVHPLIVPVLLPPAWRTPYVQTLERIHLPFGQLVSDTTSPRYSSLSALCRRSWLRR